MAQYNQEVAPRTATRRERYENFPESTERPRIGRDYGDPVSEFVLKKLNEGDSDADDPHGH